MYKRFYYLSGNFGMTISGSFTRDKARWITFSESEVQSIGDKLPYGATKRGVFMEVKE